MVLRKKRCYPPIPEANNLKPAHAKSYYALLSEDAINKNRM